MLKPVTDKKLALNSIEELNSKLTHYSAAAMASLRAELIARKLLKKVDALSLDEIFEVVDDHLPAAIESTRHYQTLQALVHCSRRSLLPDPDVTNDQRTIWESEIKQMESKGIR